MANAKEAYRALVLTGQLDSTPVQSLKDVLSLTTELKRHGKPFEIYSGLQVEPGKWRMLLRIPADDQSVKEAVGMFKTMVGELESERLYDAQGYGRLLRTWNGNEPCWNYMTKVQSTGKGSYVTSLNGEVQIDQTFAYGNSTLSGTVYEGLLELEKPISAMLEMLENGQ